MPTYEAMPAFKRGHKKLTNSELSLFEKKLDQFISDLADMETGRLTWFRPGLRVTKVEGASGLFEMSWDGDGRATFTFGPEQVTGKRHIVWHDIGGHEILP